MSLASGRAALRILADQAGRTAEGRVFEVKLKDGWSAQAVRPGMLEKVGRVTSLILSGGLDPQPAVSSALYEWVAMQRRNSSRIEAHHSGNDLRYVVTGLQMNEMRNLAEQPFIASIVPMRNNRPASSAAALG
jgi:hypothetical protein